MDLRVSLTGVLVAVLLAPSYGLSQTPSGKWELEVHGGGLLPTNSTGGTVSLPGPVTVFTTATSTTPVPVSRRESSWYFGDGPVLFRQVAESLAQNGVGQFPGRIVALDPVLGRSLAKPQRGSTIGMRVSRELTPRLAAELTIDYSATRSRITPANSAAIEATRASFVSAFNGLITLNPNRVLQSLTSTAALDSGNSHDLFTSGALLIDVRTTGKVIPYGTIGAGVISATGTGPSATLKGNYQFLFPAGSPINETDNVTIRDVRAKRMAAGILGGGLKYHASSRWGVRFDARVALSKNAERTSLDARPNAALGLQPVGRGTLRADPTIVFSNNWTDPVTADGVTAIGSSTLSGSAINAFRAYSGTGIATHTNITAGVFWRF